MSALRRAGGMPPRRSQIHVKKPPVYTPPAFAPGDTVRWGNRYEGIVVEIIGSEVAIQCGATRWRLPASACAMTGAPQPAGRLNRAGR